ncbi:hypothetical protein BGW41_000608 [Actinomortierella wolfii]|nr:hypothetical protein BGW41_000608 [Actinomortierella wolfii]
MPRPLITVKGGSAAGTGNSAWIPPTPLPKIPLSKPPISIQVAPVKKIRKRHKVAKSCDGCRQNKRRCDNEMPCSNCKRRNYDCTYTSAQLSRSTWGDAPLSPEKVYGSKALNMPETATAPGTSTPPTKTAVSVTASTSSSTPVPILPAIRPVQPVDVVRSMPISSHAKMEDQRVSNNGYQYLPADTKDSANTAGPEDQTDYGRWEKAISGKVHRTAQMARVAPTAILPGGSASVCSERYTRRPSSKDKSEKSPPASTLSPQQQPASVTNATGTEINGKQSQDKTRSQRYQKIAANLLSLREHNCAMYLPRHIGQTRGRFWTSPPPPMQDADKIPFRHLHPYTHYGQLPAHLKVLPRDAEYLIHVYFKFSYYYAPYVNKSVALMHLFEPDKQAHDYFILNVLFMGACKHLARKQDIQRAIEFRDRARALERMTDPWKLTRIQASALGSSMVYGVFYGPRSYIEHVGVYRMTSKDRGYIHPRTLLPTRASISEASYQTRLWLFWAIYVRDCINRLYWGWPCGIDPCRLQAELPEIEGYVGLGGTLVRSQGPGGRGSNGVSTPLSASTSKRSTPSSTSYVPIAPKPTGSDVDRGLLFVQPKSALGKKRENEMESRRKESSPGKRQVRAAPGSSKGGPSDRHAWRGQSRSSDDDDDDDDDDGKSEDEIDQTVAGRSGYGEKNAGTLPTKRQQQTVKRPARAYDLLDLQSKGEILVEDAQGAHAPSVLAESDEFEIKPGQLQEHLDRMEYLLNAENDVTDDGTYCRAIFLQEVKLWAIGNRLALYLASDRTVRPKYPTVSFGERHSDVIAATIESGRYSERAWAMDRELQNLQAELIQWERELPEYMRFRMDYDQPDVDHRVNGKLAILTMHYYTMILMLQSAWLPTPLSKETESFEGKALSSPSLSNQRASSTEAPSRSMTESPRHSDVSSPTSSPSTPSNSLSSPSPSAKSSSSKPRKPAFQPAFLNTAHEICTELSHLLLRHIDLCLTRYPDWCVIQAKVNHSITVALRVCCINAHLITNDAKTRSEAKAGFAAGSVYLKQLAMLPEPLTVRDRPQSEEIRIMEELESDFAKMALIRENMDILNEAMEQSDDEDAGLTNGGQDAAMAGASGGGGNGNTGLLASDQQQSAAADQDPVAQLETLYSEHFPEIFFKDQLEFGISQEGFGYDFDYEDEWG